MRAVFHGELSMVQLLLHLGVKVNEKGGNGWTVLMCAAHDGKVECVRILTLLTTIGFQLSISPHMRMNLAGKRWISGIVS